MLSTSNLLPEIFHEDALLNFVSISFKYCYFTYDLNAFFKYIHLHLQVQFILLIIILCFQLGCEFIVYCNPDFYLFHM